MEQQVSVGRVESSSTTSPQVATPSGITTPTNFVRQIVEDDLASGRHTKIITRFPPEPNGYLHLGHAKSICLNFGLAKEFGGSCNLRFDDTNPEREKGRYIESIKEDVSWLGGDWGKNLFFASDYFQQLYQWAVRLIELGLAYVDEESEEEVRANRGDLITPGTNSKYRDRSIEENLKHFEDMRLGRIPEGGSVLRAKIDMSHGNMNLRDPPIYRVKFCPHPRTGDTWKIYPIYDFAHGQCDSIEKITHSICTLEFEAHRPLYDWFQEKLDIFRTRQIEFARLNCTYMVMSKRKLLELVEDQIVDDWDDPRLPTISGMRRRGFPAVSIQDFCERIGVAKRDTTISIDLLEHCVSTTLHNVSLRRQVVISPLKVIITSIPIGVEEEFECPNHPDNLSLGYRKIKFGREIYIERTDFMVDPPPDYRRLSKNTEVRLRFAYWIKCTDYKLDSNGDVVEIYCTHDPTTRGGNQPADGRKVKGTLHWVSAINSIDVDVRMYGRLFLVPDPETPRDAGKSWKDFINPNSLKTHTNAKAEPDLTIAIHPYHGGVSYQFERVGYFVADFTTTKDHPVFNRVLPLTDSWAARSDGGSQEAQKKMAAKLAREKAAEERQKKKEQRELKKLEKLQLSEEIPSVVAELPNKLQE